MQLYIPINIPHVHWFLGVLDFKTVTMIIYDTHQVDNYFSEDESWFIAMQAHIHKLLMGINYWGSKPTDVIPLETFKITLVQSIDVLQHSDDKGNCGVFLCWILEMLIVGKSLRIQGSTNTWVISFHNRIMETV